MVITGEPQATSTIKVLATRSPLNKEDMTEIKKIGVIAGG
jgi:hypothetical protein